MAMPPFHKFMGPALQLMADGQVRARSDIKRHAVEAMHLSADELAEQQSSGVSRASSRAGWAVTYLTAAAAIERVARAQFCITDFGRELLRQNPDGISLEAIEATPGVQDWLRRSRESAAARRREDANGTTEVEDATTRTEPSDESPIEQLIGALSLLDQQTGSDLIDRLREQPPIFLEKAVLKLLHAMGYGGSAADGEHLGKSHDGGLDGVIRQDALGIERVYVQAKRYKADNTVGAAAVREFAGALTDVGASGGVLITTSSFSPDARKFAERNPRIILIDGDKLGRFMVQYGVGVAVTQTLRVTEVDENFFDEE